jgi:hypothetical protein
MPTVPSVLDNPVVLSVPPITPAPGSPVVVLAVNTPPIELLAVDSLPVTVVTAWPLVDTVVEAALLPARLAVVLAPPALEPVPVTATTGWPPSSLPAQPITMLDANARQQIART